MQVYNKDDGQLVSVIDSHGSKLRRPTGLAVSLASGHVYVVDIGGECVRKYRYM